MDYDLNIVNVCTFLCDYLRNGHTNVDIFESMLESLAFDYSAKPERRVRSRIANGNQKNPEREEIKDIVRALPSLHDIKEMKKEALSGVLKRWDKSEEELAEALLEFLSPAKRAHEKNTLSEWKADGDFSSFILGVFLHSIKLSELRASNRLEWEAQSKKASSKCMEEANAVRKVRRGLNANCTKDPNGSKNRATRNNTKSSEQKGQVAVKANSTNSPNNSEIQNNGVQAEINIPREYEASGTPRDAIEQEHTRHSKDARSQSTCSTATNNIQHRVGRPIPIKPMFHFSIGCKRYVATLIYESFEGLANNALIVAVDSNQYDDSDGQSLIDIEEPKKTTNGRLFMEILADKDADIANLSAKIRLALSEFPDISTLCLVFRHPEIADAFYSQTV